jgi:hypothetical protein
MMMELRASWMLRRRQNPSCCSLRMP